MTNEERAIEGWRNRLDACAERIERMERNIQAAKDDGRWAAAEANPTAHANPKRALARLEEAKQKEAEMATWASEWFTKHGIDPSDHGIDL